MQTIGDLAGATVEAHAEPRLRTSPGLEREGAKVEVRETATGATGVAFGVPAVGAKGDTLN